VTRARMRKAAAGVSDDALAAAHIVAALRSAYGVETASLMTDCSSTDVTEVCPTGMEVFDRWVCGVGGIPYGRVIEIFGKESSGKTTLVNKILAGAQHDGAAVGLVDVEQTWNSEWALLHGVDLSQLFFVGDAEYLDGKAGMLAKIETIASKSWGVPVVLAIDSVAGLKSEREDEEGIGGKGGMAEAAREWSRGLRILNPLLKKNRVLLVLVNQVREKPGVMFGPTATTPGGNAIKHYASLRFNVYHGKQFEGGRFMGVQAVKSKVCPPYRKASFKLFYDSGFDDNWSVLDHAKDIGCVAKGCRSVQEARQCLGWDVVPEDSNILDSLEDITLSISKSEGTNE